MRGIHWNLRNHHIIIQIIPNFKKNKCLNELLLCQKWMIPSIMSISVVITNSIDGYFEEETIFKSSNYLFNKEKWRWLGINSPSFMGDRRLPYSSWSISNKWNDCKLSTLYNKMWTYCLYFSEETLKHYKIKDINILLIFNCTKHYLPTVELFYHPVQWLAYHYKRFLIKW